MTILAIDTASTICACGLYDPEAERMIASRSDNIGRGHAEHLMGQIESVLADARMTLKDVSSIGVTVGPGSFTGIRVGVAAARGFALALGVPARGVTTLQAIAQDQSTDSVFAVALKAGRDQIYLQSFAADGAPLSAPAMTVVDEMAELVPADTKRIFGNASDLVPDTDWQLIETPATGAIETIARLSTTSDLPPSPLYLRGADAKVQTGFAVARAGVKQEGSKS